MNRKTLMVLAENYNSDNLIELVEKAIKNEKGDWYKYGKKFINFLLTSETAFSIFAEKGNIKLPFLSFSVLPLVTCSGAGDCKDFCYSLKAWRYPAAFFRQLQNTILMASFAGQQIIYTELKNILARKKYIAMKKIDFRLYVDGDFQDNESVTFWFNTLQHFPKLAAYGYSKSFTELLAFKGDFPANYALNISSGHNHTKATINRIKSLEITRGDFVAVNIGYKVKATEFKNAAVIKAAKKAHGKKAFICGGRCATCTTGGHICGNIKAKIDIILPLH